MFKILLVMMSLFFSSILFADVISIKEDAPKSYVVKKGDTLWDISGVFLEESWLWPKLWRLNPEISNPHLIYPGDVLHLVFDANGQPMLVRDDKPRLKWTPQIRSKVKEEPVATLPLSVVAPFLRYDTILTTEQLDIAPTVIGNEDGVSSAVEGIHVYVDADLKSTKTYGLYHRGNKIVDPETDEFIGYHAILIGSGKTSHIGDMSNNEPSTLFINNAKQEIITGTVLPVHEDQQFPSYFSMQPVNDGVNARIIQSINGAREFGKLDILIINKGSDDLVQQGDIFTIKHTPPSIIKSKKGPVYESEASLLTRLFSKKESRTYKLPQRAIGKAMAFKVYEKVSIVLILNSQKPVSMNDVLSAE